MRAASFAAFSAILLPATLAFGEETPAPVAPVTQTAQATEPTPTPAAEVAPAVVEETPAEAPVEPAPEAATEAPAAPSPFTLNAFVSGAYVFNLNDPAGPTYPSTLRVFDFNDNSFVLDVAEVVVQKAVANPGDLGFRVDLTFGSTVPVSSASFGQFPELQQAYVSYLFAGSSGLRLDFGKFMTHMGYEVIEGYDGWNDNYSRGLLFGWAIPFAHTGLKLSMPLTSELSGALFVVNGWDNALDTNEAPSVGLQLVYTGAVTAYLNYIGGPEGGTKGDLRHVIDVIVTKAFGPLALTLNGDFGTDAALDGSWYGAALYAKYSVSDALAITLRGEFFADPDGVRTIPAVAPPAPPLPFADQSLYEVTLTPSYTVAPGFVVRGEVRFDGSSEDFFATSDDVSSSQLTLALNALASF